MTTLPTSRELQALKVLWSRNRCTVREIYEQLRNRDGEGELAYTTVLSLMQTMERKGLVERESVGRGKTHHYHARARAETTMRDLAAQFLHSVFDGAVDQYLVRALEACPSSHDELAELERMIADARKRVGS